MFFTKEQADAVFKVPENENGAKLLKFEKMKEVGVPDFLTDAEIKDRAKIIREYVQVLEATTDRKFLTSAQSAGDINFAFGSEIKNGVKLLGRMAKYSSDHSDKQSCRRYLRIAARLSNGADNNKGEIPILIRIACAAMIEARLRRMIPKFANDPSWLAIIERALKDLDKPYDLLTVEKLEHLQAIQSADIIKKETIPVKEILKDGDLPLSVRLGHYLPRYQPAIRSRMHEYFSNLASLIPADPYDWHQMQKARQYSIEFSKRKGWSYEALMSSGLFEGMPQATWKEISTRNALMQAVEILKSKADPAKGLPLSGRYQLDLDGKPIRIKRLAKGWVIYSIWDDSDDGGVDISKGHGDFVVHLSTATAPPEAKPKGQKFLNSGGSPTSPLVAPPTFKTSGQTEPE